jgi:hypothetical protein
MHYDDFKKTPLPSTSQCLFGHLLVKNGDIVMKEELFNTVYNLIELRTITIGSPPLPEFTKCKLYNYNTRTDLTINEILTLRLNAPIYLRNIANDAIYEGRYTLTHIFTPYFMNLYKLENPRGFSGAILPAMPSHASDLNPRTCIFRDANDNVFYINVEGREPSIGGMGLDLFDLATLCKALGAVEAINLDGGGSSIMEIKEKNYPMSEHIGKPYYNIGNIIKIVPK